jgi:mycothiol synthase
MSSFRVRQARVLDAAAVADVVASLELAHYGHSTFAVSDLEDEWRLMDLERDTHVVLDGGRIVAYGALRHRSELGRCEGYVHPDAQGRGCGELLVSLIEQDAAARGARRLQNGVLENDAAAHDLLRSRGYRDVRRFREMRIELVEPPARPVWPDGVVADALDPDADARAFYAAHQEAFADHWDHEPRPYEEWRRWNLEGEHADLALWCVVRAGNDIAAGTICTHRFGGGWVDTLFTRRPWRGRGVGAALLQDAFRRFWDRGERNVGLGVDAESDTGAFRLYERAGMRPALGWTMFEKELARR